MRVSAFGCRIAAVVLLSPLLLLTILYFALLRPRFFTPPRTALFRPPAIEYVGATVEEENIINAVSTDGTCHCNARNNFLNCDCHVTCDNATKRKICIGLIGKPSCFPTDAELCGCVGFLETEDGRKEACNAQMKCKWTGGLCERAHKSTRQEEFPTVENFIAALHLEEVVAARRALNPLGDEGLQDLMAGMTFVNANYRKRKGGSSRDLGWRI